MPRKPLGDRAMTAAALRQAQETGPLSGRPHRSPAGDPLPARGRSPQSGPALARCRRRPARSSGGVSGLAPGLARQSSGQRHRRSLAGRRRSRPRRTGRHRTAQGLWPGLAFRPGPPGCPGGQTGPSRTRRSLAREGTARHVRVPPVRYLDNPVPSPARGPVCAPIRGPVCVPIDNPSLRLHRRAVGKRSFSIAGRRQLPETTGFLNYRFARQSARGQLGFSRSSVDRSGV